MKEKTKLMMPSDNSVIKVTKISNGLKEYYRSCVFRTDISFGITTDVSNNTIVFLEDNVVGGIRMVVEYKKPFEKINMTNDNQDDKSLDKSKSSIDKLEADEIIDEEKEEPDKTTKETQES